MARRSAVGAVASSEWFTTISLARPCARTSPLIHSGPAARPGAQDVWVLMVLPSRNSLHSIEDCGHDV
uniref:Putative secreted protein n=1 Tax=Ixodes ricinus TaxID=34613 RepID=A0A6B0TQV1_IXORI